MSDCQNCQDSILSKTKSLITNPSCSEPCPDIICEVLTYPTCIPLTKDYSCLGVGVTGDDTLSDLLDAVELKCASGQASANIVKASSDDSCPGTLITKLDSETLNVTLSSPSGCQQVLIEEKDWTWTNLTLGLSYTNGAPGAIPPIVYANPSVGIKNNEIRFRGLIKVNTGSNSYISQTTTLPVLNTNLPVQFRPSETKIFQFISNINSVWVAVSIIIYNTGLINTEITRITSSNPTQYTGLTISLDHISYIK